MNVRSLFFSFVLLALVGANARAEVEFKNLSFTEAKQLAAKEHKAVMIDFYTTWCGWCKVLDRKTYTDDNVAKIANTKFVCVKIDAEKGEGIDLAKQYKIQGYPTIIFFNKDGGEIDRVVGYQDAPHFAKSLEQAASGGAKALIEDIEKNPTMKDASKWLLASDYYAEHGDNAKSLAAFKRVIELDPDNKQNLKEEAMYGVGFLSEGEAQWKALDEAVTAYPMREEGREAELMLLKHDFDDSAYQEAARRVDKWAITHPQDMNAFNFFAWTAAEHNVLLDRAEEYAKRAVSLAEDPTKKAIAMDTQAEVLFREGRAADAAKISADAIALVDQSKNAKLYAQMKQQKSKFDAAVASGSAGAAH
jgi:thioredoxin-related protein